MFCIIKSIVFKIRILTCLLLCRSYRVRSRTNEDTFEANTLLQKNGASNDAQTGSEVDTGLPKIGTDITMMFRLAKEE